MKLVYLKTVWFGVLDCIVSDRNSYLTSEHFAEQRERYNPTILKTASKKMKLNGKRTISSIRWSLNVTPNQTTRELSYGNDEGISQNGKKER